MSKPLGMTYHEYYGELPTALLRLYRKYNASPMDHDILMEACGGDWDLILAMVENHSRNGYLQLPLYL
jgi:hypothetical protein